MGVLAWVEKLRYRFKRWQLRKRNRAFIANNPNFALPPSHLAFDAYSSSHWDFYKISGEQTAEFLLGIIQKHFGPNPPQRIYEWGCGPGRVIRQLPAVLNKMTEFHGSDYNAESIEWCNEKIPGIRFIVNGLEPPLPYPDHSFDFIYGISVFTHLSKSNALLWANELLRVLKPGGIVLVTTAGDEVYEKELLPAERKKYETEGIVTRANYKEGKKMFLAMHNPGYVREKLLSQFEIIEHGNTGIPFMRQDWWVAKKMH